MNPAQDFFILCFFYQELLFFFFFLEVSHQQGTHILPQASPAHRKQWEMRKGHSCTPASSLLAHEPWEQEGDDKVLTPRDGEQREREAGKEQGWLCPSHTHGCAGSQGNSKTQQHQDNSSDGVLAHSPTQTAAGPPRAAQREPLSLPSPKSSSCRVPCLGIRAQLIPAGPSSAHPRLSHSAAMERRHVLMGTEPLLSWQGSAYPG